MNKIPTAIKIFFASGITGGFATYWSLLFFGWLLEKFSEGNDIIKLTIPFSLAVGIGSAIAVGVMLGKQTK